jgi:hypothetical protein
MVPGITKALQGLGELIVRLWNGAA